MDGHATRQWIFTLPHLAEVVGWFMVIAGFGLAALQLRRAGEGGVSAGPSDAEESG